MKQRGPNKKCKIATNKIQKTRSNQRKYFNNNTRKKTAAKKRVRDQSEIHKKMFQKY